MKVVYIAPLKALVRERVKDWKVRLEQRLGHAVVELTGDVVPDSRAIGAADVIVTTPEKWDGVSRSWQTRQFVRSVSSLKRTSSLKPALRSGINSQRLISDQYLGSAANICMMIKYA